MLLQLLFPTPELETKQTVAKDFCARLTSELLENQLFALNPKELGKKNLKMC